MSGTWRPVIDGESFPPGCKFRVHVVTGEQEVFEPAVGTAEPDGTPQAELSAAHRAPDGPPSPLSPNDSAMWLFLMWWFKGCRRGMIEVGWTAPSGQRGIRRFRRFDLEDEAILPFVVHLNMQGANVYVRAATIAPDDPAGKVTDRCAVEIPGLWADLDTPEHIAATQKVVKLLRPNAWVVTGCIPNLRAQLYIRLDEVLTDGNLSRSLNTRLARF